MRISLNLMNEFVDLKDVDIKDIVSRLSLATAEVEGYEEKGRGIKGVVVGEIITCEKHPTSNKPLSVLTVDNGEAVVPVVCGAPNCRVGMKVALAKVGAKLGDFEIKKAVLAGKDSHGMCCGGDEIGISNDHGGIIELDPTLKNGTLIEQAIPEMVDTIIEIDNKSLTNRPDLWGHYGIARELSVIFNKPLKPLKTADLNIYKDLPKVPVTIENKKDCLSYGAIRVDNITRKTAPLGMQIRLFYCGMNAHNFLVDLTNYIMLEVGQPNHAFDAAKVGKLSIGSTTEKNFTTLKDQVVETKPEMLFIKSDGKPVALAGVIGGKNSEIDSGTKNCVFEFATFDAACVRKTAGAIGVRTDASNRFEKSLDINLNALAAARTMHFIKTYDKGAKVVSNFNHVISQAQKQTKLSVRKDYLERFCGITFDYKQVGKNLAGLGFAPVITADEISVTVPSWRATKDITCEADVIEEIVRTFGYDNIKAAAPKVKLVPVNRTYDSIKELLCSKYGFDEVHSYIWNDARLNKQLNIESPSYLRVVNSCIKDNDAIRSEIMPTMIGVVSKNFKQTDDIRIFEIGRVFTKDKQEQKRLGICIYSKKENAETLYKKLADILRDIFGKLEFELGAAKQNYLHPKNNALIKGLGTIGIVHPNTMQNCAVAEVLIKDASPKQAEPVRVSKYPKTVLDFTFLTDKVYGEVEKTFYRFSHPLCMGWGLKDVYCESDNKVSYTLAFTVGSYEKTLESIDIDGVWKAVVDFARKNGLSLKE